MLNKSFKYSIAPNPYQIKKTWNYQKEKNIR